MTNSIRLIPLMILPPPIRKIIHIDMDAFYASIEQRDAPELLGKPVVVGGKPDSRAVVSSASYEARRFGIRSAMSCAQAKQLCPQAIFIRPQFEKYVVASRILRTICEKITSRVEPIALDEAYLDVTENTLHEPLAGLIAQNLKKEIYSQLKLTASAGVGPNKLIAKIASDLKKPNGLVIIPPEKAFQWIESLPVEKFWGVGPVTLKKLHSAGIYYASDVRRRTSRELCQILGSYGSFLFELAHGRDDRQVEPHGPAKSRGTETTFDSDILDSHVLLNYLEDQANELASDLKQSQKLCRSITLKIKYSDFSQITRSSTFSQPTDSCDQIAQVASSLLIRDTQVGTRPVRLLGISVSNFIGDSEPMQLSFDFYSATSLNSLETLLNRAT